MKQMYYSLMKAGSSATINIYGDITSFPWLEGDVSSSNLSKQLAAMNDVEEIEVHINSYGGEVAEGLAIYNALKQHPAKVKTFCDGFACSIASVIFMAGDERIMNESSLLMIHNAWTLAEGNAEQLRKQADDLEKITQASVIAYKAHSNLSEEEIKALLDAESWLLPEEALEFGFATSIAKEEKEHASQSAKMALLEIIKAHRKDQEKEEQEKPEEGAAPEESDPEEPEVPDEESNGNPPQEETAPKWSGFFNALLNM